MKRTMKETLKFLELESEAVHALKDLRMHAPLYVSVILKYIRELKRMSK